MARHEWNAGAKASLERQGRAKAYDASGREVTYEEAFDLDRAAAIRTGHLLAYLSMDGKDVVSWPGIKFNEGPLVHLGTQRDNFGGVRVHLRFKMNGEVWSGYAMGRGMYGRFKRTKLRTVLGAAGGLGAGGLPGAFAGVAMSMGAGATRKAARRARVDSPAQYRREVAFNRRVVQIITARGGEVGQGPWERLGGYVYGPEMWLLTRAGRLQVTPMGTWVAMRFEDVESAREFFGVDRIGNAVGLNPYSGKWNWTPGDPPDLADFERKLDLVAGR